jgi:RNA polymerase sigma-70 factor, ECF subfamily
MFAMIQNQSENDLMMDQQPDNSSDRTLIRQLQQGQDDAALQIYMRYAERLIRLARRQTPQDMASRFDPEDIVQSVFRTFFRRASSGQYALPEGEELWKLLLVIALNKVRAQGAYHRAKKRDVRRTSSLSQDRDDLVGQADEDAARWILESSIDDVIKRQPETNREIIRLRIEGHEVQSIAEQTQRSKRTIERVLQNFRTELLKEISIGEDGENAVDEQ